MSRRSAEPGEGSYLARLGFPGQAESASEAETIQPGAGDEAAGSLLSGVRSFTAQHLKVLSVLAVIAVVASTWLVMSARTVAVEPSTVTPTWIEPTPAASQTPPVPWVIHVRGAVLHPGVVSVPAGSRVVDAIDAAGGLTEAADPADLNLAAVLVDGCQILIGTVTDPRGEIRLGSAGNHGAEGAGLPPGSGVTAVGTGNQSAKLSLNQATEAQLDSLPGIGPVTAQAIVAWRERSGPFTDVSQLQEVDGIGPKTFAQLEPLVTI